MTKKHFDKAAKQVNAVVDEAERKRLAAQFASFFEGTNPRFDRGRFISACLDK